MLLTSHILPIFYLFQTSINIHIFFHRKSKWEKKQRARKSNMKFQFLTLDIKLGEKMSIREKAVAVAFISSICCVWNSKLELCLGFYAELLSCMITLLKEKDIFSTFFSHESCRVCTSRLKRLHHFSAVSRRLRFTICNLIN